jgi:hypothetical protein
MISLVCLDDAFVCLFVQESRTKYFYIRTAHDLEANYYNRNQINVQRF